jgi:glycosyltransferase involved in cell wall biosynthesis
MTVTAVPLISCLMVTRDRVRLAGRALRCLAAQTWPAVELVVIDDGDQDYEPVLAPLRARMTVRYCKLRPEPGRRLGALRNLALDEARGELCAQWDDDEWYHPDRLTVQARAVLPGTARTGEASGPTRSADDAIACVLKATLMHVDTAALAELPYRADAGLGTPGTIVHRRTALRYPNLARNEDGEFLAALARRGRIAVLDRSHSHLFIRCFHGANTWEARHFERRLRRTPIAALHWVLARLRGDLRYHPQLRLTDDERRTIDAFLADGRQHSLFSVFSEGGDPRPA